MIINADDGNTSDHAESSHSESDSQTVTAQPFTSTAPFQFSDIWHDSFSDTTSTLRYAKPSSSSTSFALDQSVAPLI
ncbi:unnamed protein product, partial [Gongylonema pulchrum]|uniref:Uncharacterized protein n=1 Tax=Gongylonema pulchrum TaxID=637853 RepID=A0A183F010_9BILA